jgi:phenylalanyl-tRNA synthetase beta chain
LAAGVDRAGHWAEKGRIFDYFALKGLADHLTRFFPELNIAMENVLVPDSLLKAQGIKIPVFALETTLKFSSKKMLPQYRAISSFPSVRRDLAFVVDRSVRNEQILSAIHSLKIQELQEAECFDVFQDDRGEKLSAEKKSLAYALTYRSPERTLTDKEVNGWQETILSAVQQKIGATLR